jgi:multidrug efflux pump subunit AcrA (membrane-fusion protein)
MRTRTIVTIVIIVFLGLVGWRMAVNLKAKAVKEGEVTRLPVEVQTIAPVDFDETLNLTGSVMAESQAEVPAKVSGKIIKYLFEEGAWVKQGQPVVAIDRDEVGVEFKEATLEAPTSGWLTRRYFDPGARANPGVPLFQIADYRRVKLVVSVPEPQMSKVKVGSSVQVTLDALPDQTFSGRVKRVSPTVDYLSRTAKAEVSLANPGLVIRPGMYGRAEIKVRHFTRAVVIPTTAILEREEGKTVFVEANGKAAAKRVEVLLDMGETSAIREGLSFGERVIVSGQHTVANGSDVSVIGGR